MGTPQPVVRDSRAQLNHASTTTVPFLDLKAQYATIRSEVLHAVERVLESQHFILGKEVQQLESEVVQMVGAAAAVGCASGSDGLYLALCALDIGPGDEVITVPFTFVATAGAIARTGAKPVFVDIDPTTYNLDPHLLSSAITEKTRAIIPVHLFGLPADMKPILKIAEEKGVAVIEDAAQAIGATYDGAQVESIGNFGCFSFFPSKNLGCAGDGGMVTTTDERAGDKLRLLRAHGSREKYSYEILGVNSQLDSLQAAILRVKLPHLITWERGRRSNADTYRELFANYQLESTVTLPTTPSNCTHVYNQFVIRCPERSKLQLFLRERGFSTEVCYPSPLHLQQAFAYLGYSQGAFPVSETACREVMALPIYPELAEEVQNSIVRAISQFYQSRV
ncbi:MAG TPA: DegT/DnrJ/EryC1/StrS family aminotransferase [Candidatus Dormibacteraeota bacterium]|nr:DegT/DnrJ/EryC1/StrS family aminotransferase [Candidatus Dormibacteraeota bacterium]